MEKNLLDLINKILTIPTINILEDGRSLVDSIWENDIISCSKYSLIKMI